MLFALLYDRTQCAKCSWTRAQTSRLAKSILYTKMKGQFFKKLLNQMMQNSVRTILRRGIDERYILHLAAGVGDTTLLKILLKNKIDINKRDALGRTPLLFALLYDRTQCAKMLLDQGADYFSLANDQGKTLLMVAAERRNIEGLKLLLNAGANIFAKDNRGWTALTHAAFGNSNMHNRDKCIKLLKSVMEDRRIR